MDGVKELLVDLIKTAPHGKLLSVLFKELKGELDGKPLKVSYGSSGKQLVLKGWLVANEAISVRYAAAWDNLDGGTVTFQSAKDKSYKTTTNGRVVYAGSGGKLTLKLSFKDLSGNLHSAKFYTVIM